GRQPKDACWVVGRIPARSPIRSCGLLPTNHLTSPVRFSWWTAAVLCAEPVRPWAPQKFSSRLDENYRICPQRLAIAPSRRLIENRTATYAHERDQRGGVREAPIQFHP